MFQQETSDLITAEARKMELQISNTTPKKFNILEKEITINYCLKLTMIDGKTFGLITNSSPQICGI